MTALALCPEPDLVVFDEPTTALDVTTQIDVLAAIKEAIRDTGVAALYITHDLAVVAQVSDHIMVLRHGKMVEYGETDQIINQPAMDYTKALVSVRSIDHEEKTPSPQPILTVEGVTARYKNAPADVLKNVNVEIHPGQTLAVVGGVRLRQIDPRAGHHRAAAAQRGQDGVRWADAAAVTAGAD